MTNIDPATEKFLLSALFGAGAMTETQLEEQIGVDQINEDDIAAWAASAAERGLVEPVAGSTAVRRWHITDEGRRGVGNEPNRR